MEFLKIPRTLDTPEVVLDKENGIIELSAKSIPEDAYSFYKTVYEWLEMYIKSPAPTTFFIMRLEYYNTASTKQLYSLLFFLKSMKDKSEIIVEWHCRNIDEEMYSNGLHLQELLGLKFNFIFY